MSRGGGVRRPSVSSPSQMENNPNILPHPPPPPPSSASPSSAPVVSPSNLPTTSSSSSHSPFARASQPSTPLASTTGYTHTNGQTWAQSNNPDLLTAQSVEEGTEYPFHISPSEPSTPLHRKPAEYTASTLSSSSAPLNTKKSKASASHHGKRASYGRPSLEKVKAALTVLGLRKPSSPTSGKDRQTDTNISETLTARSEPQASTSPHSGFGKDNSGMGQSSIDMPGSPSHQSLLDRRKKRNGGSVSTEVQPESLWAQPSALSQPEISHQPTIPPVMLTPPEDERHVIWQAIPLSIQSNQQDISAQSSSFSQAPPATSSASSMSPRADGSGGKDERSQESTLPSDASQTAHILTSVLSNGLEAGEEWLKDALKVMLISHPPDFRPASEAVRLISHALPCPLPPNRTPGEPGYSSQSDSGVLPESASAAQGVAAAAGYFMLPLTQCRMHSGLHGAEDEGITTALNAITSAIQKVHGNDTRRVYIHVSHAISSNPSAPKLQSSNLTGSSVNSAATSAGSLVPSAFLTSPAHERDFFSSSVFNSIVMAHDPISYATPAGFPAPILHRPSPNPALPPFSLHFSLLERYIPPSTPTADAAMFSPYSSVLLDRVSELSPNGGSLLFIYPTKTGAKQFLERYLGKVLDPLLRRLMVLHRLRDDLLWGISRMVAVEGMQEFDALKVTLEHFCRRLSDKAKDDADEKRFTGPIFFFPNVSLVHAQKANVSLSQSSWREWWTFQESTRIRETVKNHFTAPVRETTSASQSQMMSESHPEAVVSIVPPTLATAPVYTGPSDLAREILDGVKASTARPSSRGMGEAVFASSMVGPTPSWPVVGEVGSPIHKSRRMQEPETIEVGVFVLRRHG
ncbi:hypothetical protein H072_397 [Dactylellina haptotyla CBS 200.50]|uniref:Uncharacterized protein n=1 Tax=Dactylellina haptotyla (strain CBS 200.50) TaxID=1284197 RepID=S8ARI2_DACHA|nr:hypothetical protein H072_397 [Dactylellina haptotyla CBS 200.50]